jgi:DNA-binding winged helix-turn-helix (wHTH) protein
MADTDDSRRFAIFGQFRFDLSSHELRRHGTKLPLEEKAAQLLCALIDGGGTVVSRQNLHRLLWPNGVHVDFDHGLNKCINKLRLVLGDDPSKPRFIETLSRRGYRFIAPIEFQNDPMPSVASRAIRPPASLAGRKDFHARDNLTQPFVLADDPASQGRKSKLGARLAILASLLIVVFLWVARFSFLARTSTHTVPKKAEAIRSVVVQKSGGIDPLDEGFKMFAPDGNYRHTMRNRENQGRDRWKLITNDQNYYYRPLSEAEKDFALRRDWKLTCVCALGQGEAFAQIDFGKYREARRFDITFLQEGNKHFVALSKQISPNFEWERKIEFPGVADVDHPHTYELRYDHAIQTASLWIDGQLMASGYHGHNQFREDRGLLFGASSYLTSQVGIAVFRTVRFEAY